MDILIRIWIGICSVVIALFLMGIYYWIEDLIKYKKYYKSLL